MNCLIQLAILRHHQLSWPPPMSLEMAAEPSRLLQRLRLVGGSLRSITETVEPIAPGPDLDDCLVWKLEKQVGCLQAELSDSSRGILSLKQKDQGLFDLKLTLDKALFDMSLRIERLLSNKVGSPATHGISSGIKLPKFNVHSLDGNILNWNTFWQQLNLAIHSKAQLDDTEKLAYLSDALKDRPARHVL